MVDLVHSAVVVLMCLLVGRCMHCGFYHLEAEGTNGPFVTFASLLFAWAITILMIFDMASSTDVPIATIYPRAPIWRIPSKTYWFGRGLAIWFNLRSYQPCLVAPDP